MANYQIFVKHLDGKTHCLQIPSPIISGEILLDYISLQTLIPLHSLRLVTGTLEIRDKTLITAKANRSFPSITVLLRLRGGKGGFGSLLRGAATKAGQKKTNNFDACRDMSGRRLRHVNAEKKLEEWKAEAEGRQLEKLAEDFLKKKAKEVKKGKGKAGEVEKYLEKYREDSAKCAEAVDESVKASFQLYKESKRKVLPAAGTSSSKRLKLCIGKLDVDESDSDDELEDIDDSDNDDHDVKSVVIDDGSGPSQCKEDAEGSSPGIVGGKSSDGDSLGEDSEGQNSGEVSEVSGNALEGQTSQPWSEQSNLEDQNEGGNMRSPTMGHSSGTVAGSYESSGFVKSETKETEVIATQNALVSALEVTESNDTKLVEDQPAKSESVGKESEDQPAKSESTGKESLTQPKVDSTSYEQFSFEKYNSAAELEVLGMEKLKVELQSHGLKCGGTLQERAARLFLLKSTPLDKLPKKVLAAKAPGK